MRLADGCLFALRAGIGYRIPVLLADGQIKNSVAAVGKTDTGLKACVHPISHVSLGPTSVRLGPNLLQMRLLRQHHHRQAHRQDQTFVFISNRVK